LAISSRYLSDLLKEETGKSALEQIHIFLIGEAKNLLMSTDSTIAKTALCFPRKLFNISVQLLILPIRRVATVFASYPN
jgi:hypothetical protein